MDSKFWAIYCKMILILILNVEFILSKNPNGIGQKAIQ